MFADHLPSRPEPTALSRSNGKCPNGVMLVHWRSSRLLMWTPCPLPPTKCHQRDRDSGSPGWVEQAEKYAALNQCHNFTPVAIETAGPLGPESFMFLRELDCHLKAGSQVVLLYLQQCLSVTVQQGNATAVRGTMGDSTSRSPFDFYSWPPFLFGGLPFN